jgi:hypothetical protein
MTFSFGRDNGPILRSLGPLSRAKNKTLIFRALLKYQSLYTSGVLARPPGDCDNNHVENASHCTLHQLVIDLWKTQPESGK